MRLEARDNLDYDNDNGGSNEAGGGNDHYDNASRDRRVLEDGREPRTRSQAR